MQNQYSYCFNSPLILVDMDGAWPSLSDMGEGLKNVGKGIVKVAKDFVKSDIGKVVVTGVAIVGIGAAAVATGGVAGVALGAVAAGAAGGATVGGISNMITGGSFANGFVGGAISGGIAGGAAAIGLPGIGNFVGGTIGSGTTMYLDDPSIDPVKLIFNSAAGGLLQNALGRTVGKLFDSVKVNGNTISNAFLEYCKAVYDVGGSTVLEVIFKIFEGNRRNSTHKLSLCPTA